jgi:TolB-like protein
MSEIRFGPFRLDLAQRRLMRDEAPVALGSRALDILCVLARAQGRLVSKDDLMAEVWPGVVVEDNNIQVHVSALRKALSEGDASPNWLVTVPGRGYRFVMGNADAGAAVPAERHDLPDKPSLAVLPFANLSADADQEYFADGITEDIITALTLFRWFFVIARNSSFVYKGRAVDVKQVARELGVRYVLEGSVRRSAHRVRINARLVDAVSGSELWGERFDRELTEVFAVQDEITERVVGAIEPELLRAEGRRAAADRLAGKLGAWDVIRQGTWCFHQLAEATHLRSLELFREAAQLAPDLAEAHMWRSRAATGLVAYGWGSDPDALLRESMAAALLAVRLDERDAYGHFALAMAHVFRGDLGHASQAAEKATEIAPSFALAHIGLGMSLLYAGRPESAIDPLTRGLRLNPFDPQNSHWFRLLALARYFLGDKEGALVAAQRSLKARPGWALTLETAAVCYAALGRMAQARECVEQMAALPKPKGDPTDVMKRNNPSWGAEIARQLRRAGKG